MKWWGRRSSASATRVAYRLPDGSDGGWLNYTCAAPFSVLLRTTAPDGSLRRAYYQAVQPIDATRTRLFFMVRSRETDPGELAAQRDVEEVVQAEDLRMNASLPPAPVLPRRWPSTSTSGPTATASSTVASSATCSPPIPPHRTESTPWPCSATSPTPM